MYTCTMNEVGYKYSNDAMDNVVDHLYNYILEQLGIHQVINTKNEAIYHSCRQISSPGNYIIHFKHSNTEIDCKILKE